MWYGIRFEVEPTLAAIASLLILVSAGVLAATELLRSRAERFTRAPAA
jgi:ABC-type spermidine/putrescine transport system permease subunit II